jgi:hypothetical protein
LAQCIVFIDLYGNPLNLFDAMREERYPRIVPAGIAAGQIFGEAVS